MSGFLDTGAPILARLRGARACVCALFVSIARASRLTNEQTSALAGGNQSLSEGAKVAKMGLPMKPLTVCVRVCVCVCGSNCFFRQMERRCEEKECDWLERVTSLEAELDGLRAQAVETRGRLRRAESSSPSAEVFER